jgi:hypothetical protein
MQAYVLESESRKLAFETRERTYFIQVQPKSNLFDRSTRAISASQMAAGGLKNRRAAGLDALHGPLYC